jgi:hypothetical protein
VKKTFVKTGRFEDVQDSLKKFYSPVNDQWKITYPRSAHHNKGPIPVALHGQTIERNFSFPVPPNLLPGFFICLIIQCKQVTFRIPQTRFFSD